MRECNLADGSGSAIWGVPGGPRETVGLYYYRLRYYDPAAGRFIARDPKGLWGDAANAGNGQVYCGNNPVNWVDPWGLDTIAPRPWDDTSPAGAFGRGLLAGLKGLTEIGRALLELLSDLPGALMALAGNAKALLDIIVGLLPGKLAAQVARDIAWLLISAAWAANECTGFDQNRFMYEIGEGLPGILLGALTGGLSKHLDELADAVKRLRGRLGGGGMLDGTPIPAGAGAHGGTTTRPRQDPDVGGPGRHEKRGVGGRDGEPRLDSTGKVHGDLPGKVPDDWTADDIRDMLDELDKSIPERRRLNNERGANRGHGQRLAEEERFRRQLEKKLADMGQPRFPRRP